MRLRAEIRQITTRIKMAFGWPWSGNRKSTADATARTLNGIQAEVSRLSAMTEPKIIRVRRLDGRMTPVNLDELEFIPGMPNWHDRNDPRIISHAIFQDIYLHPEFRFVLETEDVHYRGPRPGDNFAIPCVYRHEIHRRAWEVATEDAEPKKDQNSEIWLGASEAWERLEVNPKPSLATVGRHRPKFKTAPGDSRSSYTIEFNSLVQWARGWAQEKTKKHGGRS